MRIEDLAQSWRTQAALYSSDGVEIGARVLERCAEEVERALAGEGSAPVSLTEAARLSGYSPDHLGRLVRDGKLRNYGTRHRPRVQRGDLPRKPALTPVRRARMLAASQ